MNYLAPIDSITNDEESEHVKPTAATDAEDVLMKNAKKDAVPSSTNAAKTETDDSASPQRSESDEHAIKNNKNMDTKKVAVIGGAGYIGSYLSNALQSSGFEVTIFDKDPKLNEEDFDVVPIIKAHSTALTQPDLAEFGTVVFLGGCTGRKTCDQLTNEEVEKENVSNVIDVMKKMSSSQHFIAASTSAVAEGTFGAKEDSLINPNLLDSYSLSMFKREIRLKEFIDHDDERHCPKISLLRFGTVVGNSPGQRTDLMVPSFFRSAYTTGFLKVGGHNTMRSFLTLNDLSNAFITLISKNTKEVSLPSETQPCSVWNLASFHATVLKVASTVASLTGASIDSDASSNSPSALVTVATGFSLDSTAFEQNFNFTFGDSLQTALLDFDRNVPDSIIAKGPHTVAEAKEDNIMSCPVCGSTGQQTVLDLGSQPLANDFFPDRNIAIARPRFPLKLVRCRVCNHYHLSHVVDRSDLFEHYLYQSGTSATLSDYFEWLAQKVMKESDLTPDIPGNVLEIACNDGSQLDHFKAHGWRTFGVDPAANLAAIAAGNHIVHTGFWPLNFPELPRGNELTAITAQNVAAHVPDVVAFLKGCANVMGPKTKLNIQTYQCNMQHLGQFDTVYHEHISFFTGHSFLKAAELSGLYFLSFETTPIHGESCLVTMKLDTNGVRKKEVTSTAHHGLSLTLNDFCLVQEKRDGVASEFFASKFSAHAISIREWMKHELLGFKDQGYIVGGYGAAAKGMVLLHFILGDDDDGSSYLDFVLDDAKLKQNTYCPGTVIPVHPTASILELSDPDKPLVMLVLAWNFFDEIANRIVSTLKESHREEVTFLVPFPEPQVIHVDLKANDVKFEVLRRLPHHPTPIPNPITNDKNRVKAIMVTHQRNEELLMPFFIMQHASMFDKVTLIDFESDDRTLEIIERFAPPSWEVVKSSTGAVFDAIKTDDQVMEIEKLYPNDWVVALTTTEFLIKSDLRQALDALTGDSLNKTKSFVVQIPILVINGNNTEPLSYSKPLPKQRYLGGYVGYRFMHYRTTETYSYEPGRHKLRGRGAEHKTLDVLIMKFGYAPWPEVKQRKMEVGKTIPKDDVKRKFGYHHTARLNESYVAEEYLHELNNSTINLCHGDAQNASVPVVNHRRIFHEVFGKCD